MPEGTLSFTRETDSVPSGISLQRGAFVVRHGFSSNFLKLENGHCSKYNLKLIRPIKISFHHRAFGRFLQVEDFKLRDLMLQGQLRFNMAQS